MERRVLDINAAAEYLSVGDEIIRALVKAGRLPRVMISKKKYLFDVEDLNRLIESEKTESRNVPQLAPVRTGAKRKKADETPFKWLEKFNVAKV